MTSVNSGTRWELTIRDYLQALGYTVIRAAGSRGPADLVAISSTEVLLIQAKKEQRKLSYADDKKKLKDIDFPVNARVQLWVKTNRKISIYQLYGEEFSEISTMKITDINNVIKENI